MSGPSDIKIQKAGEAEIGNAQVRSPASDLDRLASSSHPFAPSFQPTPRNNPLPSFLPRAALGFMDSWLLGHSSVSFITAGALVCPCCDRFVAASSAVQPSPAP
jgi:hypothetical protein